MKKISIISFAVLTVAACVYGALVEKPGCIDETACNYNDRANTDDGTCEYTSRLGCTDANACNYNSTATVNDESCEYTSCSGCTDAAAMNYNSEATIDDGSCVISSWSFHSDTDKMSGKTQAYAGSSNVLGDNFRGTYRGTASSVNVGFEGRTEWAYLYFTSSPNLTNDDTKSGYNSVRVHIKFDNEAPAYYYMTQEWGSKFLHFNNDKIIQKIKAHSTMLVELQWYGSGSVYFEYDLTGSSYAMSEAKKLAR